MKSLKRTPLYPLYGHDPEVRCIDFGGWELPVQFSSILKEHEAVREVAGLFDVSHMGEFLVSGEQSLEFIQQVTTNDVAALQPGQAQYSLMCNERGGIVDDLLVYCLEEKRYMLVVNASNIESDWQWLQQHVMDQVSLENISQDTALLALQGPAAESILAPHCHGEVNLSELKPFHFLQNVRLFDVPVLLSRTGYTGEDGFEIYGAAADAPVIWRELLKHGQSAGLVPAGLGARDTLRLEARLALYGQELSADITPLEAGLSTFVKLEKNSFVGKEALLAQKSSGIPRALVGIEMVERGIPRTHYKVYADERIIGEVTSGTSSPTLKRHIGLALIERSYAALGTELMIEIRGKHVKAVVVRLPFYKRPSRQGAESK